MNLLLYIYNLLILLRSVTYENIAIYTSKGISERISVTHINHAPTIKEESFERLPPT